MKTYLERLKEYQEKGYSFKEAEILTKGIRTEDGLLKLKEFNKILENGLKLDVLRDICVEVSLDTSFLYPKREINITSEMLSELVLDFMIENNLSKEDLKLLKEIRKG